jgi:RND family efflux transporter MFP subunit
MKKRIIIIGVVVLIIAAIALKLASNKKTIDENKKPVLQSNVAIPVNTTVAGYQDVNDQLVKTGNLVPFKEADIMAVSGGKLIAVNFVLGSRVSEGAVIAQVDSRGLQLSLEAAQLTKAKADKDFKRYKTLLEGEATTEVTLQDAKLSYDNAVNQMEQINKQMSDNRIKAPVSGQVVSKVKEAGEYVSAGTVLGHIVDVSRLKVNVMVGEKDAYTLQPGQKVKMTTDIYPGTTFEGKITFISSQGDATHNYQVEIEMVNSKDHPLKAGTFIYADFSRQSQQKLMLIPRSALVESLKNPFVYVIENGKSVIRKINVGREIGDNIEVLDGLKEGDEVIIAGQVNIKEGSLVKGVGTAKKP